MNNESFSGNNVNHREFLKTVGVAATASSLAPYVLADGKSGNFLWGFFGVETESKR